jgi:hypothetical protein
MVPLGPKSGDPSGDPAGPLGVPARRGETPPAQTSKFVARLSGGARLVTYVTWTGF